MELAGIRNDSESQKGGLKLSVIIRVYPRRISCKVRFGWQPKPTGRRRVLPGTERKSEFLLTKTQSELFSLFCDKRTSRMHGWCSSRLRVEPIFGQIY